MKKVFLSLVALSATLFANSSAKANTIDTLFLTGGSNSYTFDLPETGTPSGIKNACPEKTSGDFCYNSVKIDDNGVKFFGTIEFFTAAKGGGLEIFDSSHHSLLDLDGAQLFTGSLSSPTLVGGLYDLTLEGEDCDDRKVAYHLNLDPPSPVPEPSSLALLSSGILGAAGVVRRRLKQ